MMSRLCLDKGMKSLFEINFRNFEFVFAEPRHLKRFLATSVTRFGEILSLWQSFTCLWQFFDILFLAKC